MRAPRPPGPRAAERTPPSARAARRAERAPRRSSWRSRRLSMLHPGQIVEHDLLVRLAVEPLANHLGSGAKGQVHRLTTEVADRLVALRGDVAPGALQQGVLVGFDLLHGARALLIDRGLGLGQEMLRLVLSVDAMLFRRAQRRLRLAI